NCTHFPHTTLFRSFFEDLIGYSAGDNIMLKTSDGGTTWIEIPFPVTNRINDIKCLNENTIFAGCTNGFLINSTNGGNNWTTTIIQHNQSSPNIYDIYFLNANTGFLGTSGSKIF